MPDKRRKQKALPPIRVEGIAYVRRYLLGDGRTRLVYPTAQNRHTKCTFADAAKALEEGTRIARELHNGGREAAVFTPADRASFSQAQRDIEALGITVHQATSQLAEARRICGSIDLMEVVRAGLRFLSRPRKTVPEIVTELLLAKQPKDLQGRYRRGLETTLKNFAEAFPGEIGEISPQQIEAYLVELKKESRRRDNMLKEIRHLFRFAWRRKYLAEELTAARQVDTLNDPGGKITYFTPAEIELFLEEVKPEWRTWMAIAAFSGVRSEEIYMAKDAPRRKDPLRWEDFDWDSREICVRAETAKTGHPRRAPILDNLWEWLRPFREENSSGRVVTAAGLHSEIGNDGRLIRVINRQRLKEARNGFFPGLEPAAPERIVWHNDGLRHSYGSYRMAVLKNMDQLSSEMGNSVPIIKRHYHNPRSLRQAQEYFAIRPQNNIIPLPGFTAEAGPIRTIFGPQHELSSTHEAQA